MVVSVVLHLFTVRWLTNIVAILNSLPVWCAWILGGLVCVSIPWIYRVSFASAPYVFHFWFASFRLGSPSKTRGLCGGCQLLLWAIFCGARLKIIIISIGVQIPFQRSSPHLLGAICVMHLLNTSIWWFSRLRPCFFRGGAPWRYQLLRITVNVTLVDHSSFSVSWGFLKIRLTYLVIVISIFLQRIRYGFTLKLFSIHRISLILNTVTLIISLHVRATVSIVSLAAPHVCTVSIYIGLWQIFGWPITVVLSIIALPITRWLDFCWAWWVLLSSNYRATFRICSETSMALSSWVISSSRRLPISALILIVSDVGLICGIQIRIAIEIWIWSHPRSLFNFTCGQFLKISNARLQSLNTLLLSRISIAIGSCLCMDISSLISRRLPNNLCLRVLIVILITGGLSVRISTPSTIVSFSHLQKYWFLNKFL